MNQSVLHGELAHVRLGSLLQLAEAEGFTGGLVLEGAGTIAIAQGQPVAARCGRLAGVAAVRELFFAEAGRFWLELGPVAEAPPLGPVIALVMDGARVVDEWERLAPLHLRWDAEGEGSADEGCARLVARARAVLARLDGRDTTRAAVTLARANRGEVTDPLRLLLEEGHLEHVDAPADAVEQELSSEPFDALLVVGRARLRSDDIAGAEEAFRAALRLRPDDRVAAQNLRHAAQRRAGRWPARDGWRRALVSGGAKAPPAM